MRRSTDPPVVTKVQSTTSALLLTLRMFQSRNSGSMKYWKIATFGSIRLACARVSACNTSWVLSAITSGSKLRHTSRNFRLHARTPNLRERIGAK